MGGLRWYLWNTTQQDLFVDSECLSLLQTYAYRYCVATHRTDRREARSTRVTLPISTKLVVGTHIDTTLVPHNADHKPHMIMWSQHSTILLVTYIPPYSATRHSCQQQGDSMMICKCNIHSAPCYHKPHLPHQVILQSTTSHYITWVLSHHKHTNTISPTPHHQMEYGACVTMHPTRARIMPHNTNTNTNTYEHSIPTFRISHLTTPSYSCPKHVHWQDLHLQGWYKP